MAKTNSHKFEDNFIEAKFYGRVELLFAWSYLYFHQDGIAQKLLHYLKYKNTPDVGIELGKRYAYEIKSVLENYHLDMIIPVPLHFKRLKKRGYNQSEKFAQGISLVTGIPVINGLKRTKATSTQTAKNRVERWSNVDNIFKIDKEEIKGKRVLLVDDVITTGATIEACVQELENANCKVGVLAIGTAK